MQLLSIFIRGLLIACFGAFSILAPAPIQSTGSRARCVIVVVVYALWLLCACHTCLAAAHLRSSYSWLARPWGVSESGGKNKHIVVSRSLSALGTGSGSRSRLAGRLAGCAGPDARQKVFVWRKVYVLMFWFWHCREHPRATVNVA